MTRAITVFTSAASRPMEAIESIIALTMFIFGCYLVLPITNLGSGSAVGEAFGSNSFAQLAIGLVLYILPALPIVVGLFWEKFYTLKWRTFSTFSIFISSMFITLLRLVTIGPEPLIWLFTLAIGLVSAVCYLYMRVRHARV